MADSGVNKQFLEADTLAKASKRWPVLMNSGSLHREVVVRGFCVAVGGCDATRAGAGVSAVAARKAVVTLCKI